MINSNSKIYIAGHNGLVGSAILKKLRLKGYKDVIFRNRNKLDLKDQKKVFQFLKKNKPDFIFIAAAKVGGIYSNNNYKAEYIFINKNQLIFVYLLSFSSSSSSLDSSTILELLFFFFFPRI